MDALIQILSNEHVKVSIVKCSYYKGDYCPLMYSSNHFEQHAEINTREIPKHVRLIIQFDEPTKDLFELLKSTDLGVITHVSNPVKMYKKIIRPDCEEKDKERRIIHDGIMSLQREAISKHGIPIGITLGKYTPPVDWTMNGEEYMDYDMCRISIDCSSDSDVHKELVRLNLM